MRKQKDLKFWMMNLVTMMKRKVAKGNTSFPWETSLLSPRVMNDPCGAPDFPPGIHVLAVYPGTTALYKARVVHGHSKRKKNDYVLESDHDEEEDGSLPQRTVPFYKVVLCKGDFM